MPQGNLFGWFKKPRLSTPDPPPPPPPVTEQDKSQDAQSEARNREVAPQQSQNRIQQLEQELLQSVNRVNELESEIRRSKDCVQDSQSGGQTLQHQLQEATLDLPESNDSSEGPHASSDYDSESSSGDVVEIPAVIEITADSSQNVGTQTQRPANKVPFLPLAISEANQKLIGQVIIPVARSKIKPKRSVRAVKAIN